MEHEVTPTDIFHDKEEMFRCLEAGVEAGQEGRLALQGKNLTLIHRALYVILLHNQILLQAFDGIDLFALLVLGKEYLYVE